MEVSGKPLIITDRGKPVLQLMPYSEDPAAAIRVLRETVVKYRAPAPPVGAEDWESGA